MLGRAPVGRARRHLGQQLKCESAERAAQGGRRIREHPAPPIREVERSALYHPVAGEILPGEQPATPAHVLGNPLPERPAVQGARTGLGQRLQKVREIGVRVPVTGAGRPGVRREEGAGVGREGIDGRQQGERVRLGLVEHDALPRHLHRRCDDAIQCESAEPLVHVEEARERTGHRDRTHADVEDLIRCGEVDRDRQEVRLELLVGKPATGCIDEEVEEDLPPLRGARQHEAPPSQTREHGLRDGGGETRGERGVEGAAAGAEDRRRGLRNPGVPGGHDAPHQSLPAGVG